MQVNLLVLQCVLILSTPVLSQFDTEIRPDVTFGDHNDRFDVSDLVAYQNKYFRADGSIDYRRRHHGKKTHKFRSLSDPHDKKWLPDGDSKRDKYVKKIRKETEEQLNKLANIILLKMKSLRRFGDDSAVQDDVTDDGEDVNDNTRPNKNLKGDINYRRIGSFPDTFNYAFPIEMQVEGFLVPPENL